MPTAGARLADGSGLDREGRVTATLLTTLLARAADPDRPELRPVLTGLPVAGFSGTLSTRYEDAPGATGLVRAKTGTLNRVNSLAGTVVDPMIPEGRTGGHPRPGRLPGRLDQGQRRGLPRTAAPAARQDGEPALRRTPAVPCSVRSAARSPASSWACCSRSSPPGCSANTRRTAPATRELPAAPNGGGRLLLVAPNIVHVERELDVDPHDSRLWVALHEETHRTQFTGVPWLRDHLQGEIQTFLDETDVDPMTFLERLREAAQSLSGAGRPEGEKGEDGGRSLVDVVQTPAQREVLGRLTAVMSLLEGHADFVMDGVGPEVVGSVSEIREKFQRRRAQGAGRLDQALRKLLGLDAKLRQYKDGEKFVRSVVEEVGMDGFNRVWTSPNTLPTKAEIAKPAEWVARVHRKAES
ncbi:hypothetical protein SMICM304S_05002 [Streptomyces microflavus]